MTPTDVLIRINELLNSHFFPLFKDPNVPLALSLIILLIAAAVILWIIFQKSFPTQRALKRLIKVVQGTKDEFEFAANFDAIQEAMSSVRFVRHSWHEFVETLILPLPGDERPIIKNSSRPSVYLNLAAAEHAGLRLRFFQAVPNWFVGVGLILTFLGLVAALNFAMGGVTSEDMNKARESMGALLGAATFKFLTSIAGIFSSIAIKSSFNANHIINQVFNFLIYN